MYHSLKSGKKQRKNRRLLGACFVLAGLWAAALGLLLLGEASAAGAEEAPSITLLYRGSRWVLPADGRTAGELLAGLGLELTDQDILSLPRDTPLVPGMVLTVEHHESCQEVYTISIPPETEYRPDDTLPWGQEAVLAEGIPGEMRCTAQVDYVNGVEVRRTVTGRQLLKAAQSELIAFGCCENPIPAAGNGYLWLPDGELLTYTHTAAAEATGFTPADAGAGGDARPGMVAADPNFIPPGTRLYILADDGSWVYGIAQARASTAMEGRRVDLCFETEAEAAAFGRRSCTLYFLG